MKRLEQRARDIAIYLILKETGCKVTELLSLRLLDIRGDTVFLNGRALQISSTLKTSIERAAKGLSSDDLLFKVSSRRISQSVKALSGKSPREIRNDFLRESSKPGIQLLADEHVGGLFTRDDALIQLINETGLKTSQIASLRAKMIDRKILHIGKARHILSDDLSRLLMVHSGKSYVFEGIAGKPISSRRIQQILGSYGHTASKLRKAYAFRMYLAGKGSQEIKSALKIKHVNRFTHGMVFP